MEKIKIVCSGCQAKLAVPETAAGKLIRCPKCQTEIQVPPPVPDNAPLGTTRKRQPPAQQQPAPKTQPTQKRRPAQQTPEDYFDSGEDSDLDFLPSDNQSDELDWDNVPTSRNKSRSRDASHEYSSYDPSGGGTRSSGRTVNTKAIYSGIGLIALAFVWFFGALLFLDTIFYYPPILAIIGIVSVVKGLMGSE